jgi:transglutaminase-like putative cysteine protease
LIADVEGRSTRGLTLAMIALATTALELAIAEPGRSQWLCVVTTLGLLVAPALALAWFLSRRVRLSKKDDDPGLPRTSKSRDRLQASSVLLLVALFLLPFVGQLAQLVWWGRGLMLEVVLLAALRNLGLGLGVLSHRPAFAKPGALISLFLVLVAASLGEGTLVIGFISAYSIAATFWLMLLYWDDIALDVHDGRSKPLPWSAALWVLAIVSLCGVAAVGPTRAATALAGLVPSSGGTDWNDPDARGGVNDGDNEVSASENPQSVGFTQSEVYLDTDRPSLYDTFNEMYGEPFKNKKIERMIALPATSVREQKERPVENLQAAREFPLVRRKPDQPARRPGHRAAKALLYLKGPTPLHIRMATYARFDGKAWSEPPAKTLVSPLDKEKQGAWLRLVCFPALVFRGRVSHQIKVGLLDSDALPVPAQLDRFRMGSVDRPDFFGCAQDGILRMVGRTIPAGTVIETESRVVDPKLLARIELPSWQDSTLRDHGRSDQYVTTPEVAELGKLWVSGRSRGWEQVEAVVDRLRRGYHLDREATSTDDPGVDPVSDFLLRSRRGADYQFASAAVVLLRSLGYSARVVSGFYAQPQRYDVRTRHTPVLREDVHFWAEVQVSTGLWVTIEPSPGYQVLEPAPTLVESLAKVLAGLGRWGRDHRNALGIGLVLAVGALWYRREWLDGVATLVWRWNSWGAWSWCVLATLSLVERRSRWAGRPRPPGQTPSRWYGPIAAGAAGEARNDMDRLVRLADWILYAPEGVRMAPASSEHDVRSMCRRVVRDWTLGRFRASAISPTR